MSRFLVSFFLTLAMGNLCAQSDSTKALDEIVVTANRLEQRISETGKVMQIITKTQIENSPFQTLGELLSRQSGITVIGSNNAPGTNNDLYIRGAGTGKTLILIDGFPAYDASTIRSTFDINFLPLTEIEKIEILKGAQSTLYGSDAVAGVINIITKTNKKAKPQWNANLYGGSYGTRSINVSSFGQTKQLQYKIQYSQLKADGFSAAIDSASKNDFDKDGMSQQFALAQLNSGIGAKWNWRISGQWSSYENDLDQTGFEDAKDYTAKSENLQWSAGIGRTFKNLKLNINYNVNNNIRNYIDDSLFLNGFSSFLRSDYTGNASFLEANAEIKLNNKTKLFTGVENRWLNTGQYFLSVSQWGKYETSLSTDSTKTTIGSAFVSMIYKTGKFNLEGGARLNRHSRFGNNLTYSFNPSYAINQKIKLAFNLYSAFTAPSLYQLYDPGYGDKKLKPETSTTAEFSLNHQLNTTLYYRLTAFKRRIKNGIDYDFASNKYFNYNLQRDWGIEFESGFQSGKFSANLNYTYMQGKITTVQYAYDAGFMSFFQMGDTTYANLFRVPRSSLNAQLSYQVTPKLLFSFSQRIAGERFEPIYGETPIRLNPYSLSDLGIQYKFNRKLKIYFNVKNLFDVDYQEVRGYATRGINYLIGIRL